MESIDTREKYLQDCVSMFGHIVEHKLLDAPALKEALPNSVAEWEQLFPEEPYNIETALLSDCQYEPMRIGYDLVEAVGRKKKFHDSVCLHVVCVYCMH